MPIEKQTCNRCNWQWWPTTPKPPEVCPRCNTPYWNKPRKYKLKDSMRARNRARNRARPRS